MSTCDGWMIGKRVAAIEDITHLILFGQGLDGATEDTVIWPAGSTGTIEYRETTRDGHIWDAVRFDEPGLDGTRSELSVPATCLLLL